MKRKLAVVLKWPNGGLLSCLAWRWRSSVRGRAANLDLRARLVRPGPPLHHVTSAARPHKRSNQSAGRWVGDRRIRDEKEDPMARILTALHGPVVSSLLPPTKKRRLMSRYESTCMGAAKLLTPFRRCISTAQRFIVTSCKSLADSTATLIGTNDKVTSGTTSQRYTASSLDDCVICLTARLTITSSIAYSCICSYTSPRLLNSYGHSQPTRLVGEGNCKREKN